MPDSLMSTVCPLNLPQVLELMLISTSILKRGWRRASTMSGARTAAGWSWASNSYFQLLLLLT